MLKVRAFAVSTLLATLALGVSGAIATEASAAPAKSQRIYCCAP